ncbi:hypothetical protein BU25DRAFT_406265 [Macroventuria anomochaeta]|uniref:Uncharacterized protein n=1 Tax=Macroventuria anomochaeta TaxID=301207 RepID=A0ACB6SF91_9PLEO|nr:uncharacterized protein BU25DRAFT_406265 [Macroventuria anomochaeta]KAF2632991.1 hypothetical protein BU25DRAFT_406265 [Macroventuria anomochaeta]
MMLSLVLLHPLKSGKQRYAIQLQLRSKFTKPHTNKDELIDQTIDLAARLLFIIDFGDLLYGFSGNERLQWETGPIEECVASHFGQLPSLGHEGVKFGRPFNASSLVRVAGLELVPTSNLLDHLRLIDDDTKLNIFFRVSF